MKKLVIFLTLVLGLSLPAAAQATTFDLLSNSSTQGTVITTKYYGTSWNTDVAVKNPGVFGMSPYDMSFVYLEPYKGHMPFYKISELNNFNLDLQLLDGNYDGGDGLALGFVDANYQYHELRAYFYKYMTNDQIYYWLTTPNVFDANNPNPIWRDFSTNTFKTWAQVQAEYGQSSVSVIMVAFDNPLANYAFDNIRINGDTWSVIDEVIPTPTPEPVATKAEILVGRGVNGVGIYRAPGLAKQAPNVFFANGN